jgi:hypothetical protein
VSEQRKAKNEALFRAVNERIEDVAGELGVTDEASFVCECGNVDCTEMMSMSLAEYERVRSQGTHFAVLPGHADHEIERVVATGDRYVVVEKVGVAGRIADDLDTRDD